MDQTKLLSLPEQIRPEPDVAALLLSQGEMHLLKGDLARAEELFKEVLRHDSSNPQFYYRQGLAFFEYGSQEGNEKSLLTASRRFRMAIALDPSLLEAWHAWGNTLFLLGNTFDEFHFFQDAEEKYKKVLAAMQRQPYALAAELYWDYGAVLLRVAEHSGEAVDVSQAMEAFQVAASSHKEALPADFWNDFGRASLLMAEKVNDARFYLKAVECAKQAVSLSANSGQGWMLLAQSLELLYFHTHEEDHLAQANECYASAAQLDPQNTDLWLAWAKFLLEVGSRRQDIKQLRSSIEKCHRAYVLEPQIPLTLALWAEALAYLGEITDRLELLCEAQNKIAAAEELEKDSPEIYYSHGMCLCSFARYFDDYDYYYQAIETFQEGLSIDRTSHRLWAAIARTYTEVGQLNGDQKALEKSLRFYLKAIDLHPASSTIIDYAISLLALGELTADPKWTEVSISHFEQALHLQKNALYIHPDWLFHYACALDSLGDVDQESSYHLKAIEIFTHVLMVAPDFPDLPHRMALAFSHLAELSGEMDQFYRALHYFRLACNKEEEHDQLLLDMSLTLIHIAQRSHDSAETEALYREAEHKLTTSAKLGNLNAFYHLGCLYSLLGQYDKAARFLTKAEKCESLPPQDELLADEWLDGLRSSSEFRQFMSDLERRA